MIRNNVKAQIRDDSPGHDAAKKAQREQIKGDLESLMKKAKIGKSIRPKRAKITSAAKRMKNMPPLTPEMVEAHRQLYPYGRATTVDKKPRRGVIKR